MKKNIIVLFLICSFMAFIGNAEIAQNKQVADTEIKKDKEYYQEFVDVFELINTYYVDKTEKKKLLDAALNGMLLSLDPYSSYLTDDEYKDFKSDTKGEFSGIGAEIMYDNNAIKIISPIEDLPADKAGIKSGDYILAVDGANVSAIGYFAAVKKMRGEKGSSVVLTVMSEADKQTKDITIIRDTVKINPIKYHIDDHIAYIRIRTFNELTVTDLKKAVSAMFTKGANINGIILDLRNNPGGLLEEAVGVSDYFLDSGRIVTVKGKTESDVQIYSAKKFIAKAPNVPMVVLVNHASASASEIVSAALKDNKRALILGTRTFGKGLVQSVMPLNKESAVKLTTAQFYTPNGNIINGKGIEPDIQIKPLLVREDEEAVKAEALLRNYIKARTNKSDDTTNVSEEKDSGKDIDTKDESAKNKEGLASDAVKEQNIYAKNIALYANDYQYARAKDIVMALGLSKK
jgi:carboxyl-terminal processing protease